MLPAEFNIGKNISLSPMLNDMLGFDEKEVSELLEYYRNAGLINQETAKCMEIMKLWYDGYTFSEDAESTMFNTDMVLYFLSESIMNKRIPKRLIDQNVKIDYGKLRHLIVVGRKLNGNFDSLRSVTEKEEVITEVADSFPLEKLESPENFYSLLYYFGLLTFRGTRRGISNLTIPNLAVKHLMYGYIREAYSEINIFRINLTAFSDLIGDMAWEGEWKHFFDFLSEEVKTQTSVRDYLEGEKVIQGFLLAYLSISDIFIPHTEFETGKGFSDFYFEPFIAKYPDIKYGYLIELKYIKRSEKLTRLAIDKAVKDVETQLAKYAAGINISQAEEHINIIKIVLVYHGWELVHSGAIR